MAITFTLGRAAEESGLSKRSLQYAITRGQLKSVCVGGRRLIPVRELENFLLRGAGNRYRVQENQPESVGKSSH